MANISMCFCSNFFWEISTNKIFRMIYDGLISCCPIFVAATTTLAPRFGALKMSTGRRIKNVDVDDKMPEIHEVVELVDPTIRQRFAIA